MADVTARKAGLIAVVATALAVGPLRSVRAEPDGAEQADASEAKQLFYQGATAFSASNYDEAIDLFTRALDAATREGLDARTREALLMNLAKSHEGAYELEQDSARLRKARDLYRRVVREGPKVGYSQRVMDEAQDRIFAIDIKLGREEEVPEPVAEVDPRPREPEQQPPPVVEAKPKTHRKRGIALTTIGTLALGGSLGVIVYGATFRGHAQNEVDKFDDPPDEEKEFVDDEARRGAIVMGVGGGVAAVGLALLIWGAVDVARARNANQARARIGPQIGRNQLGITACVGF